MLSMEYRVKTVDTAIMEFGVQDAENKDATA